MATSTEAIWAIREVNRCAPEHYIDWAVGMLEAGHDTKYLRILAGFSPSDSWFAVEECFDKAAHELGLSRPSRDKAIREYSVHLVHQLLDGKIPPRTGVKSLAQLCIDSGYSRYLMVWYDLEDGWTSIEYGDEPWIYSGLTKTNAEEIVLKEAKNFLQEHTE